jgi:uncharacterized membrane protein YdjX (TVP38/TMEM64 family)
MKRYVSAMLVVMAFMLLIFWIVNEVGPPILRDPDPDALTRRGALFAAVLGVLLLTVDVVLPVPSSVIMLANGALFGVIGGTLLSLTGSMAGVVLAVYIGRRGGRLLQKISTPGEMAAADRLFRRWGTAAIILSRPLPILAETLAMFAGASSMAWRRLILAAMAGLIPTCLAYAGAGAVAMSFDNLILIFLVTCGVAAIGWLVDRRIRRTA